MSNIDDQTKATIDKQILEKMKGAFIECESPNEMLYKFEGNMGLGGTADVVPLGPD
jgi:hypothetical protein